LLLGDRGAHGHLIWVNFLRQVSSRAIYRNRAQFIGISPPRRLKSSSCKLNPCDSFLFKVEDKRARAAANERSQLSDGRAARCDAVRARALGAQALQDRLAASCTQLHRAASITRAPARVGTP
jgi:hypothetical protein